MAVVKKEQPSAGTSRNAPSTASDKKPSAKTSNTDPNKQPGFAEQERALSPEGKNAGGKDGAHGGKAPAAKPAAAKQAPRDKAGGGAEKQAASVLAAVDRVGSLSKGDIMKNLDLIDELGGKIADSAVYNQLMDAMILFRQELEGRGMQQPQDLLATAKDPAGLTEDQIMDNLELIDELSPETSDSKQYNMLMEAMTLFREYLEGLSQSR